MGLYDAPEKRGTIETDASVSVRLEREFTAVCPEDTRHIDHYTVVVEYVPDGEAYELQAFSNYLDDFGVHSQEEVAQLIHDHLLEQAEPEELTVTVTGRHHGVKTTVTAT